VARGLIAVCLVVWRTGFLESSGSAMMHHLDRVIEPLLELVLRLPFAKIFVLLQRDKKIKWGFMVVLAEIGSIDRNHLGHVHFIECSILSRVWAQLGQFQLLVVSV
jgi:hypothetical protein